jgi:hypothetical protein
MKPLAESDVFRRLDRALPAWRDCGGWTYNDFCKSPCFYQNEDVPFTQLIETTIKCIQELCLPNSDLMFYHDGMAGWKSVPKEIRGFSINRVDDLRSLISEQIYFRDPERYSDNYNVIDNTGLWMITFCHEDDSWRVRRSF